MLLGFGFVKRFALRYQTVVSPVCPVGDVGVLVGLGPGHILLDVDPDPQQTWADKRGAVMPLSGEGQ